jgi:alpha-galactosidase/6-phospho-beta-glucosidase family protein
LPKQYKSKVRHRPVTYGTAKAAGERSPYKKLNPKRRSVKEMAAKKRRRKRPTAIKRRIRRVRRNPKNYMLDMLMHGGITAVSAVGAAIVSSLITKMVKGSDTGTTINKQKWNNGILAGLAVLAAVFAPKFVDKSKAEAITGGIMTAAILAIAKTSFGFDPGTLAGYSNTFSNPQVDMLLGGGAFDVSSELDFNGIADPLRNESDMLLSGVADF